MSNESELKLFFKSKITRDFLLIEEAKGYYISDGVRHNVRIDFLLKAKKHLIEKGFPDKYFGVEVKFIKDKKKEIYLNNLFAQCIVYRRSIFQNRNIEPFMVLAFTNLNVLQHKDTELFGQMCNRVHHRESFRYNQLTFLSRFNVGIIDFSTNFKYGLFYEICFGGFQYFKRSGKFFGLTRSKNKKMGSYTGSNRKYNTTNIG